MEPPITGESSHKSAASYLYNLCIRIFASDAGQMAGKATERKWPKLAEASQINLKVLRGEFNSPEDFQRRPISHRGLGV